MRTRILPKKISFGVLTLILMVTALLLLYTVFEDEIFVSFSPTIFKREAALDSTSTLLQTVPPGSLLMSINSASTGPMMNNSLKPVDITAKKVQEKEALHQTNSLKLKNTMNFAFKKQLKQIEKEMKEFNFKKHNFSSLEDLVPALGGTPLRSVLVTTWRSGSTFLGGILSSHPGSWHYYEPLIHMGIVQIRGQPLDKLAIDTLLHLFKCNFTGLEAALEYGKIDQDIFQYNTRLWKYCETKYNRPLCYNPYFMSSMCKLFPIQTMKLVRLRLDLAAEVLRAKELGIKMIYMVRDPRGIMQSRLQREWCRGNADCSEVELLCTDLKANYYTVQELTKHYKDHFRVIRYEDFSKDPIENTKKLFQFLNLDFHSNVNKYLQDHTKTNFGGTWSTYRNSKNAPYHWRKDIKFPYAQHIQNVCSEVMSLWGYLPFHNESHMRTFNPLGDFPLKNLNTSIL